MTAILHGIEHEGIDYTGACVETANACNAIKESVVAPAAESVGAGKPVADRPRLRLCPSGANRVSIADQQNQLSTIHDVIDQRGGEVGAVSDSCSAAPHCRWRAKRTASCSHQAAGSTEVLIHTVARNYSAAREGNRPNFRFRSLRLCADRLV